MLVSPSTAQALGGAFLQLNPLLGLTLIWTETHLQERDKELSKDQRKRNSRSRGRARENSESAAPLQRIRGREWVLFLIFLHSITWSIVAIADPYTASIKAALAISIGWLGVSAGRIIFTITPSGTKDKLLFWLAITTTWFPLWGLVLTIRVGSK